MAEGDKVAGWTTFRGTHQAPFMGVAPSSTPVEMRLFCVQRLADGKIVETWGMHEIAALWRQLGWLRPLCNPRDSSALQAAMGPHRHV